MELVQQIPKKMIVKLVNVLNERYAGISAGGIRPLALVCVCTATLLVAGCGANSAEMPAGGEQASRVADGPDVRTGAQVLADQDFARLEGQRIGLIVNHTAQVDSVHLIDALDAASGVELTALFGPEHGLRGTRAAGEKISDGIDEATGAPVYSLYGANRKPSPEMLDSVDVLVFDIQDIGARFYTYISTLGLAMQSAAQQDIPFVVLDRPNPLGGNEMAGFIMEEQYESFVGMYPIPVQHGMTVGELARMIKGEAMLEGLQSLDLQVVETENWERDMLWPETGLPWIPPSPNIPHFQNALVYPGAGFFEATSASEGRGTRNPFVLLGAPWADAQRLVDSLSAYNLPGVQFEPAQFTPESIESMAPSPKLQDRQLQGIRYNVTDPAEFEPVPAGIYVLHTFYHQAPDDSTPFISRRQWLAQLSGSDRLYTMLTSGADPEAIIEAWKEEIAAFREQRQPYLLY